MTTTEIANKLIEYCNTGQFEKAQNELYADNAVSLEPAGANFPERTEGLDAIRAKGEQWNSMVEEVHEMKLEGPVVAGDFFSCNMKMDITMKGAPRMQNHEICVYRVRDGKIVSEQFFYKV